MEGREISDTSPVSASCYLAYISVPNFIGKSVHIRVLCANSCASLVCVTGQNTLVQIQLYGSMSVEIL